MKTVEKQYQSALRGKIYCQKNKKISIKQFETYYENYKSSVINKLKNKFIYFW